MAFRIGSAVTAGDSASTSRVVTRPAGAALDDILELLVYTEDLTLTVTVSPGTWTRLAAASGEQAAGTDFETHIMQCRQGAEAGDITVAWGGASVWNTVVGGAYSGRITTGDAQDGTATFNTGTSAAVSALGLVTAHDNADMIAFGSNAVGSGHAWGGGNERADFGGQSFADTVAGAAGSQAAHGATITNTDWAAGRVALQEAPSARRWILGSH